MFFKGILVSWVYNAVFVAALEVDVDIVGTDLYSAGLFPVNVAGAVAVFVLFHHGVTELFHDRNVQTTVFTNQWWHFFPNDEAVVTDNENGPVFIKEVQETTEVIVGLTIYVYDAILYSFSLVCFHGSRVLPKCQSW